MNDLSALDIGLAVLALREKAATLRDTARRFTDQRYARTLHEDADRHERVAAALDRRKSARVSKAMR